MRIRPTARLIIIDDQQRIFLFKFEDQTPFDPDRLELTAYWVTPGGGVEPGETYEQAALRELWEETGLQGIALGPCVWTRRRILQFPDEAVEFQERYFLLNVPTIDVQLTNLTALELQVYRTHRWWTLAAIERSSEVFLPPGLARLIEPLLTGPIPATPIELDE